MKKRSDYWPDTVSRAARRLLDARNDLRFLRDSTAHFTPQFREHLIDMAEQSCRYRAAALLGTGSRQEGV